ncbi:hypothetical protein [Marinimicrobium agarilyticum]|uniref:hypothetical protein n=1 Tax=Marinimicrobium agarilyticum TaxID=306546 RepID=UPI0004810444|nr:hypothetical protein [Marinimicrobium agarilyticum]
MILTMPERRGARVEFDEKSLSVQKATRLCDRKKGVLSFIQTHTVALYEKSGGLILQIDHQVWDLLSERVYCRFSHDFRSKTTLFKVSGGQSEFSVEYPAWWSSIPNFEPLEPEMDAEEDFMAYLCEVSKNRGLCESLISSWS